MSVLGIMVDCCLAFGVSPSAFHDYFQMFYTTAHFCLKKFCKIMSNDNGHKDVYHHQMSRADARRLNNMHVKIMVFLE
jgi:hypothetical protein